MSAQEIITFKVEEELASKMSKIPNRSDFIRSAIAAALDDSCPLCSGSGKLSAHQKKHWSKMLKTHSRKSCKQCRTQVLECKK